MLQENRQECAMDLNAIVILMLISFIIGMVMGISLVRPPSHTG